MKIVFDTPGCDFEACREAQEWCKERDIAVGSMERGRPRGLLRGNYAIAKWHNLRPHERSTLNGTMTGNMRSGPVTIELNGEESDYLVIEPEDDLDERDTANWRQL